MRLFSRAKNKAKKIFGREQLQVSNPQSRPLPIGLEPLLDPLDFAKAEAAGDNKLVNTGEREEMRRALELVRQNELYRKIEHDPIGLINELESSRDGSIYAPRRHLFESEIRALQGAKLHIQVIEEDIVKKSKTSKGVKLMEIEIAELGQKHPNLTPTEKWKIREMMYYIIRMGGESKQHSREIASIASAAAATYYSSVIPYDNVDRDFGDDPTDFVGGKRRRKTRRRKRKMKRKSKKHKKKRKQKKTKKRRKRKSKKKTKTRK